MVPCTLVADDDRNRRRLGDATKGRIADLASGWDASRPDASSDPPTAPPADAARRKSKTQPPPPPGSAARAAIEAVAPPAKKPTPAPTFFGVPVGAPEPARTKGKTTPPPPPRAKSTTTPPATPARPPGRTKGTTSQLIPTSAVSAIHAVQTKPPVTTAPLVIASARGVVDATEVEAPPHARALALPLPPERDSVVNLGTGEIEQLEADDLDPPDADDGEASLTVPEYRGPGTTVPTGEFETHALLGNDKLRANYVSQHTVKRDAASALLQIAEPPATIVRSPPIKTLLDETAHKIRAAPEDPNTPGTSRFERGDPTTNDHGESQIIGSAPGTKLRTTATLRRKRGLGGDTRYVFTVLFGVRRARGELVALEAAQVTRKAERKRNLVTLGRTAVQTELDHPALSRTSDQLAAIEEERAGHAGQVAAADQELARTRREREAKVKQRAADVAAIEAELVDLAKKREPLDRDAAAIKKRAAELRNQLQKLDTALAAAEASKTSLKGQKLDPAAIAAEMATVRADRKAVERDEPVIAAELDALEPRIAALEAAQHDARARRAAIDKAEAEDQHRVAELLDAIGAKRKVVDRASVDAEAVRDRLLFELGEALYVDRPPSLRAQLTPIDTIDMELGTFDRRAMELREILSNVDRTKLARGIAFLALILAVIGGAVGYVLYLAL